MHVWETINCTAIDFWPKIPAWTCLIEHLTVDILIFHVAHSNICATFNLPCQTVNISILNCDTRRRISPASQVRFELGSKSQWLRSPLAGSHLPSSECWSQNHNGKQRENVFGLTAILWCLWATCWARCHILFWIEYFINQTMQMLLDHFV